MQNPFVMYYNLKPLSNQELIDHLNIVRWDIIKQTKKMAMDFSQGGGLLKV